MKDAPSSEPISLILEFTRAQAAADPYAFHFSAQQYLLRGGSGGIESATLPWGDGLLIYAELKCMKNQS